MKLYHGTSADRLASILRDGLLRAKSQLWKGAGGVVYLARTPEDAACFGKCVVEVDIASLELAELSDWELVCWNDIPAARCRVYGESHAN